MFCLLNRRISQAFFTFCKIVNMYKYSKIITKNVSWKENLCYVVVRGLYGQKEDPLVQPIHNI